MSDRAALLRELAEDDTLLECVCGHALWEHNGLGCYARISYKPLVVCTCALTDNRSEQEMLRANLLARAEKESS